MVVVLGQGHFAHHGAAERFGHQCGADFFVAHLHHQFVASVVFLQLGPVGEERAGIGLQAGLPLVCQILSCFRGAGLARFAFSQHGGSGSQLLHLAGELGLALRALFVAANCFADLGQIAAACCWHDGCLV